MALKHDRTALDEIVKERKAEHFPNMKEDDYFELFVAEQILQDQDLSYDELKDGNPGGNGDGGFDGAYLFVNNLLIDSQNIDYVSKQLHQNLRIDLNLIQAKNKNRLEEIVIEKFSSTVDDVLDMSQSLDSVEQYYNDDIIRVFGDFHRIYGEACSYDSSVNISFYYVTKGGKPTANMRRKAELLRKRVERELVHGCKCSFHFVGATKLLDLAKRPPIKILGLKFAEGPFTADDLGGSFIGLVFLDRYYRFVDGENGRIMSSLFEANVRDWEGVNKVNNQILQSLKTKPVEDFWWLNNGVTILAAKINQTGKTLELHKPEIVNGLQTTQTIHSYFSELEEEPEEERKMLVRIIEVRDENETRERIVRATNSQTSVPVEAFRSLDTVHRKIEKYLIAQDPPLFYDRRRNFYKNQDKPANRIIGIKQLAQSVIASYLFKPDDARGRPSDYLQASDDAKYLLVFNNSYPCELYYACARYYQAVDAILKLDQIEDRFIASQRRAVRFFVMTHIALRLLKIPRIQESTSVDRINRQTLGSVDDDFGADCANRVLDLYVEARSSTEAFRWRDFENKFFEDLDSLLAQVPSP